MPELCIIGEENLVSGFKAAGIDTFVCENQQEANSVLGKNGKDFPITFISENIADTGYITELKKSGRNIVILPGMTGEKGLGKDALRKVVERVLGKDVLK